MLPTVLFIIFCVVENVRQRNYNNIVLSCTADAICMALIALHYRKLSWVFWTALGLSCALAVAHWLASSTPPLQIIFCAKSLPILVGSIEVMTCYEQAAISERWRVMAYRVLSVLVIVLALYALVQHLAGFRYLEEENIYNRTTVNEEGTLRLPSIFFSYVNYSKFGLAAGLILYHALTRRLASKAWVIPGLLGTILGLTLSGQRAALVVFIVIVLLQSLTLKRTVLTALIFGVAAVFLVFASAELDLGSFLEHTERGFSLSRVTEQFLPSFYDWFHSTPWFGWGFGLAGGGAVDRLAATSGGVITHFEYAYQPETILEGSVPYLLQGGGIPWLLAHVVAFVAVFCRSSSAVARQWLIALALWGMTHTMVESAYAYVFCILLTGGIAGDSTLDGDSRLPYDKAVGLCVKQTAT